MITETWTYTNKIVRFVDYDKFYCDKLHRVVDLGWDEHHSLVHTWVSTLNKVNGKLYEQEKIVSSYIAVKMSQATFNLLEIHLNPLYQEGMLGPLKLKIVKGLTNNLISLVFKKKKVGEIIIIKTK